MQIAKNILIVLAFCALGCVIGGTFFLIQERTSAAPGSTTTEQTSSTPTPTPSITTNFTDGDTGVSLALPENLLLKSETLDGYTVPVRSFTLVTLKGKTITEAGATLYILETEGSTTTIQTQKAKLLRAAAGSQTSAGSQSLTTTAGKSITKKTYSTSGKTSYSYEIELDSTYVIVSLTSNADLTEENIESIIKSIQQKSVATASPSTSPLL